MDIPFIHFYHIACIWKQQDNINMNGWMIKTLGHVYYINNNLFILKKKISFKSKQK